MKRKFCKPVLFSYPKRLFYMNEKSCKEAVAFCMEAPVCQREKNKSEKGG